MIKTILRNTIDQFPPASLFYRNLRDQLDQHQPALKTPWGFTLAGHSEMAKGDFEPEETKVIRGLLEEVDVLVNIGANVGYYCCHALSMGKSVIAAEPVNRNLHYLLRNIRENGWEKQIQVFPIAVGESTDILEMWGGGTGASLIKGWASIPASYVTQVPVLSLDRLLGDSLRGQKALVLVDIEGAEYAMLQGAVNTLCNYPKPIWMMEISATEHQPVGTTMNPNFVKTFQRFFEEGYQAFYANTDVSEITLDQVDKVMAGHLSPQSHNYIFRECFVD